MRKTINLWRQAERQYWKQDLLHYATFSRRCFQYFSNQCNDFSNWYFYINLTYTISSSSWMMIYTFTVAKLKYIFLNFRDAIINPAVYDHVNMTFSRFLSSTELLSKTNIIHGYTIKVGSYDITSDVYHTAYFVECVHNHETLLF